MPSHIGPGDLPSHSIRTRIPSSPCTGLRSFFVLPGTGVRQTAVIALCRRCGDFDMQSFHRNTFKYRGYPLETVINSAGSGCSFCSLLLEHLKSSDNGSQHSYLSIALRKKTGNQLAVLPFSTDSLLLLFRSLYLAISPAWVHFSVRRAGHIPWLATEGLNIRSLGAYVSNSRYSNEIDASDGDTP